jgi:cysteine desulfurase/selenocysteine lyase
MLPVAKIREDFPILSTKIDGRPLIYLDNAATMQMPLCVLERLRSHYLHDNANIHRGIYTLSERSTQAYEDARITVRDFLGADSEEEIVFTQGATDSINMAADGLRETLHINDMIVITELEHHSNFLPWQRLCHRTGATFAIIPCPDGMPDMEAYKKILSQNPKLVAVTQVSNLTGTVMPLGEMTRLAHEAGAVIFVDGAQGIRHCDTHVSAEDYDFYCFSGHKIMGPAGIGVLYGKRRLLEMLKPSRLGGGMVGTVTDQDFTEAPLPYRLEAGTPNYPGAIALAEAIRYIDRLGRKAIADYESMLVDYAVEKLSEIAGLHVLGHPVNRAGVVSFVLDTMHPYDAASILDKLGVAIRSGTHCAQPALQRFGVTAALRLSPAFYNTRAEIDEACLAIRQTQDLMSRWIKK